MPAQNRPRAAVLIAVRPQGETDTETQRSLDELTRLAEGLAIEVRHTVVQRRASTTATRLFGEGKLEEIAALLDRPDPTADPPSDAEDPEDAPLPVDLVLVDAEISPGQQRFLESALDVEVLDRTAVILRVFDERARTRVARSEIEIARLLYEAPRLRDDATLHARGGGGGSRGERGHTNAELARQRIRARVATLRRDIDAAHAADEAARARRARLPLVALIGYTNAGKSSLMRALTGSEVFVQDALFATLGTTVRALSPETEPKILACDTVGFIDDLPHALVASFRSTLAEAREADLLLFVVDAADPHHARQLEVSREVVAELSGDGGDGGGGNEGRREGGGQGGSEGGGGSKAGLTSRVVFNKCDRLDPDARAALAAEHPEAWCVSAHDPADVERLRGLLVEHFRALMPRATLTVPYSRGHLLGEIHAAARVLDERYDGDGVVLDIEADPATLARLTQLTR